MKRRTFFGLAASLVLAPSVLFANAPIEYTEGFIKQELAAGKTVFVDYAAVWCSTCKRQERLIEQLRKNNPEYDKNMTFVRVDWDVYSTEPVAEDRNIPRRSTLIVLRGDKELGRIVAGTNINEIKALMDKGLAQ